MNYFNINQHFVLAFYWASLSTNLDSAQNRNFRTETFMGSWRIGPKLDLHALHRKWTRELPKGAKDKDDRSRQTEEE